MLVSKESEVTAMSTEEKEVLLSDISKLKPEDKAFVLGYCAHAVKEAEDDAQPHG